MYKKVGIEDIQKFYAEKFVENRRFDVCDFYLGNYNVNFAKFFWVYRNVKPDSAVLDFGCGSGTLSVLKNKGCTVTGIDYSRKALDIAQRVNGYDAVFCGSIFDFSGLEKSFDYIVSLDVFGHIPFEEKDALILELKKFLKPGGVMLHGIECGDINYDEMSRDQLRSFIEVDGHVGVENKLKNIDRFKKLFKHVEGSVRFNIEIPSGEYIKQAEKYNIPASRELLSYLSSLNPDEKLAFDVANGLVHLKIEQQKLSFPDTSGGFLFLRASDKPLDEPSFEIVEKRKNVTSLLEDKDIFLKGWYEVEQTDENNSFRWGMSECFLSFQKLKKDLRLTIFSYFPEITGKNVNVFFINRNTKKLIEKVTLCDNGDHTVVLKTRELDALDLVIFTDTTWKPALYDPHSGDWRALGIGVGKIELL